ncbi:hypothetical protein KRX52_10560 [Pseudomonas sp. MAP12]|uniref:Uncharacterized protein n=1 Tax=Geopseudomonas aromaticivorans TaxID=2849492 RepID=A0ABS6MWR3_9GAMM|nr:hypothetical protein [Pseudomonas aromaticivorans]MBV2133239.1 hypothetical protein [Pseudomonas aromaticivorans]
MISNEPYRTPAASALDSAALPRKGLLGYLDGSQPLWKAFWLVYVLGSLLLSLAMAFGVRTSLFVDVAIALKRAIGLGTETVLVLLIATPILGFVAFSLPVVWRCADNTGRKLWTLLARLCVSLHGLWAASKLLGIFL